MTPSDIQSKYGLSGPMQRKLAQRFRAYFSPRENGRRMSYTEQDVATWHAIMSLREAGLTPTQIESELARLADDPDYQIAVQQPEELPAPQEATPQEATPRSSRPAKPRLARPAKQNLVGEAVNLGEKIGKIEALADTYKAMLAHQTEIIRGLEAELERVKAVSDDAQAATYEALEELAALRRRVEFLESGPPPTAPEMEELAPGWFQSIISFFS